MPKPWTTRCQDISCYNFVEKDGSVCDFHLLEQYGLQAHLRYDSCDQMGLGPRFVEEDLVVKALRHAEDLCESLLATKDEHHD
jgi:hypothetical protein